jgi:hypothetical protein
MPWGAAAAEGMGELPLPLTMKKSNRPMTQSNFPEADTYENIRGNH